MLRVDRLLLVGLGYANTLVWLLVAVQGYDGLAEKGEDAAEETA